LRHLKPVVQMSETAARWARPSVPLGYHRPVWPARGSSWSIDSRSLCDFSHRTMLERR